MGGKMGGNAGGAALPYTGDVPPEDPPKDRPESRALATRTDAAGLDAYEREYMTGGGALLAVDKQRAPAWMQVLMLSGLAAVGGAAIAAGSWLPLLLSPIFLFLWIASMVLRVNVSTEAVNIQYGFIGPTIPMAAIESAELRDYNPMKFGGWGIKRSFGGEWIYNMPGDKNRAVRMVWRDAKGRQKVTWIGSAKADELCAAIDTAQAALPAAAEHAALKPGSTR